VKLLSVVETISNPHLDLICSGQFRNHRLRRGYAVRH
jgi:hypothetical protein